MEKLKMHTPNLADENFKKLAALFPEAVTETIDENGEVVRAIDKDRLMQEISCEVVEGNKERYQFTWPDKKKTVLLANAPIDTTLRPVSNDETVATGADTEGNPYRSSGSVDFDNTENLYIEGDNLEALKLLRNAYLGKVKLIYIDPPYNTGNDFVYADNFEQSTEDYLANSGQFDENGNRLTINLENNGKFHTDWLNIIFPRLKLARDFLCENGAIFISIDDNEVENLRKVCDEIFGSQNFIAQLSVIVKTEGRQYGHFAKTHEYLLVYAKSALSLEMNEINIPNGEFRYKDEKGGFNTIGLRNRAVRIFNSTNRPNLRYPFYVDISNKDQYGFSKVSTKPIDGWQEVWASVVDGLESVWRWGKETAEKNKDELVANQGNDGEIRIFKKDRDLTTLPKTVWFEQGMNSIVGTREVAELIGSGIFSFPKPLCLLKRIIEIGTEKDSIVLDFFSGSATTAQAVMETNIEDGGTRKYIMIQLPENLDDTLEKSSGNTKQMIKNCIDFCDTNGQSHVLSEIGKERIRRAIKKISEENPDAKFDGGFRVLKCDTSNMKDVYYSPSKYEATLLSSFENNIKDGRTPEDLLFQVMLDLGILPSSRIEEATIAGKKVFSVDDNYLIACFDANVTENVIKEIAQKKPYYFVMRDSSMANDSVATNFDQIFETYSPNTERKVL